MPNNHTPPIQIFIAYSKHDKDFLDDLLLHLNPHIRQGTINVFYDGVIEAGKEWDTTIKHNLNNSDIILLMVSAHFVASDYCYDKEMLAAIDLHEQGLAQVIPIIVRPFDFEDMPFAKLNFLPSKANPISNYDNNQHQAYTDIVIALKKNYSEALKRREAQTEKVQQKQADEQRQQAFLETYHQADEAYNKKNWIDARKYYTEALKQHQTTYKPTRESIKKKINECSEEIEAVDCLQRADKYEQQQKQDEAIAELQSALRLKPELKAELNQRIEKLQQLAEERRKAEREAKERAEQLRHQLPTPIQQLLNELVVVESGTFFMGGNEYSDEKPIHPVHLDTFKISKYPVTQAQWQAVMNSNPSYWKGDNLPVEQLSWDDAQVFIQKLNFMLQKAELPANFRLPTEAEWEYAARGGNKSQGYTYAGSNIIDEVAWYYGNSGSQTQPVGQKKPNELGIYDMSGNVFEWCHDWYDRDYYAKSPHNNPQGPASGSVRVLRGGSWGSLAAGCRVALRNDYAPGYRGIDNGFRLALPFRA